MSFINLIVTNLIKAIIIGLGASVPMGPVGILCIQKTISKGRRAGFTLGLGSSATDAFYAGAALLSLSFVSGFLERNRPWVMLVGGIIVFAVGVNIAFKNPVTQLRQRNNPKSGKSKLFADALQGFAMTISNPGALALMIGVFAFVGVKPEDFTSALSIIVMILGVVIGSTLWWFLLSSVINIFRDKFGLRQLLILNRISGAIIAFLGLMAAVKGLIDLLHETMVL